MRTVLRLGWSLALIPSAAFAADIPAGPADYQSKLAALTPGDTLVLAAGDYANGMNLFDLHGEANARIVIAGPADGAPARFLAKSGKNTIDIRNASFISLQNLHLDGQGLAVDAIKAGGQATDYAHHITIEGCRIVGHDASQQTVGISTKIVAWDWVVRGNVIDGAGTGAYFGNSDGTRAFFGGLVENNLFRDTVGYNMQIKHQLHRQQADVPSVPTDPRVTIIRHNVFIKDDGPSPDGARPNLLVDGPPDSGPGQDDHTEIYGNLFFHNSGDALFQGNGRLHIHDNVFVDSQHAAIRLANHSGKTVIDARIYNNTIFGTATGVSFGTTPSGASFVVGNAIFSAQPFNATVTGQADNVTDSVANASNYVVSPSINLGAMDFFPVSGSALKGAALDLSSVSSDLEYDRDFNGSVKDFSYRGAYHGEGTNPGWPLSDALKTSGSTGTGGTPATGGSPGSGGASGSAAGGVGGGGSGGAPGSGGLAGGLGATGNTTPEDDGGCGCRLAGGATPPGAALTATALWLAALFRRRRRAS